MGIRTRLNGSFIFIRNVLVIVVAATIVGFGGWTFAKVSNMDTDYYTKKEVDKICCGFKEYIDSLKKDLKADTMYLRKKVDEIIVKCNK